MRASSLCLCDRELAVRLGKINSGMFEDLWILSLSLSLSLCLDRSRDSLLGNWVRRNVGRCVQRLEQSREDATTRFLRRALVYSRIPSLRKFHRLLGTRWTQGRGGGGGDKQAL